jgi:hypothetical protein
MSLIAGILIGSLSALVAGITVEILRMVLDERRRRSVVDEIRTTGLKQTVKRVLLVPYKEDSEAEPHRQRAAASH